MSLLPCTIDCIVEFSEAWDDTKKLLSSIFTINIDPFGISRDPIKFKGLRDYGGYSIISASNEKNRRIVHWFYRNVDAPTIKDWDECIRIFGLRDIPIHIIQLYNHDKDPLNKFILIHYITNKFIHYTFEDRENNTNTTVTVPLGFATLVPERFLFNMNLYSNTRIR